MMTPRMVSNVGVNTPPNVPSLPLVSTSMPTPCARPASGTA